MGDKAYKQAHITKGLCTDCSRPALISEVKVEIEGGGTLPYFLTAKNIKPFINDDLGMLGNNPIIYKQPNSAK